MIGWTLDKLPSDTEKGSLKGFCSVCRQTVSQELPAWNFKDYSYVYNCAAKVITYKLFVDENGKLYTQKPTDKVVNEFVFKNENATTYHTLNNKLMTENRYPTSLKGIVELAEDKSTCLVDGSGYFICENELCKQPVEIITYTEHNYENAKVIAYEGQEPTCKDTGKGYAFCTQCNTTRKEDITIKALGHTYHEVAYVPVVSYNPETGKFSASLNIPCSKCDHCDTSTSIKITASKAPTCLSSGYVTCEYKDYNGETITKTIFLYTADGTNPEGHGHKQGTVEQWSRYDEETKYTHYYTGFICPYCGIQFITKEVIKDKDGNVVDTIEYLE